MTSMYRMRLLLEFAASMEFFNHGLAESYESGTDMLWDYIRCC